MWAYIGLYSHISLHNKKSTSVHQMNGTKNVKNDADDIIRNEKSTSGHQLNGSKNVLNTLVNSNSVFLNQQKNSFQLLLFFLKY